METKKYSRLSDEDRIIISTLKTEGKRPAYIAKFLKRARSTITRELNLWVKKASDIYDPKRAHWYAKDVLKSKKMSSKICTYSLLKEYVHKKLEDKLSPETIAGRIKIDYPKNRIMRISYEAIYAYIYNIQSLVLRNKLISCLLFSRPKRRRTKGIKMPRIRIKNAISIDDRPKIIELRKDVGHLEGDLMIGVGQASAIGTIVDRKTRYTHIVKLANRKSETVTAAFKEVLNKMGRTFRKTMTYDNGLEMANHEWLTEKTGMKVYFAHPYSSWERGTNENTNGIIRRSFPKKTDFSQVTKEQLKVVQNKMNNTPRKVLGFRTPNEMVQIEKNKNKMMLSQC